MVSIGELISSLGEKDLVGDNSVAKAIDDNAPIKSLSNEQIANIASRVRGAFLRSDAWINGQATRVIYEAGKKFVQADDIIRRAQRDGYKMERPISSE